MGNKQQQNFQWEQNFNILERNFNDHTLILQKKQNKQEYLGRQILSTDKKQSEQIKRLIKTKYHNNNPFLTKLTQVYYNNDEAYCSPEDKIYLVFEKPKQTLRQQILARKFANEPFTEQEADIILESGAKAIRSLKEIQHPHNNISTSSIFIDSDRRILLGDPWITPPAYNQEMTQNVFACPSPQKILLQNDQIMSICPYRSDLFSLGTVVLEALNYEHMDILYEKGFRKLLQPKLKQKLSKIKNEQLRYKLSVVMAHDPHNRDEIYTLYRTTGLALSHAHIKPSNKQPIVKKINNNVQGQIQKTSPIVQLSKQVLKQDNNKAVNNAQFAQTQYFPTNIGYNFQKQPSNTYTNPTTMNPNRTNTTTINNNPITQPYPTYPTYSTIKPSINPTYYPTSTPQFYTPSSNTSNNHTPISFNNHNYQRVNYMTYTPPITSNFLFNDNKIGLPSIVGKLDDKNYSQGSRIFQHINVGTKESTTVTHPDLNSKTNITTNTTTNNNNNNNNTTTINTDTKVDEVKNEQNINTNTENNILPISIKSSNDLVNTSGNIRYIQNSDIQEPITIGNYNIKQNSQPNITIQTTIPTTIPQQSNKPKQLQLDNSKQITQQQQQQKSRNRNPPPNRQTPDKKPSRKYNSTIKQQADQHSYSGEREAEEDYEYVVEEYEAGRYEGQKQNGMRNGFGKFYYKEGSVYQGQWRDNLMNGKGNLYYANGKLAYQGDWRMDQFHGFGKVYNEDQFQLKGNYNYRDFSDINDFWASYQGELHSDRRHGKGKIKISNGQIFVGEFIADSVEGPGKFYTLGGDIIQGVWKNNKLIRTL